MKKANLILTALLATYSLALSYPGNAASLAADLHDTELVDRARSQIAHMNMTELDELREYLTSCGTRAGGEIKEFNCERNTRRYLLKYGQGKPVENLIKALAAVEFLIEAVDAADKAGGASPAHKEQVFNDVDRYVRIRQMFDTEVKAAYWKLLNPETE